MNSRPFFGAGPACQPASERTAKPPRYLNSSVGEAGSSTALREIICIYQISEHSAEGLRNDLTRRHYAGGAFFSLTNNANRKNVNRPRQYLLQQIGAGDTSRNATGMDRSLSFLNPVEQ